MSVYVGGQFKTHTEKIMKYSKSTTDFEIVTTVIKEPIFRNMIVYKPPTGKIENFIQFLKEILSDPLVTKCETWILGDFNVDILRQDDKKVIALQEFVKKAGLFQKINPLDPNLAVSARAVFPQSGRSRPEKRPFFHIFPHFSKKEAFKKY